MIFKLGLLIIILGCLQINGLQLTGMTVPEVADFRDTVTLSCSYNMGFDKLNSVKWYKNGKEFFRYSPMSGDPVTIFKKNVKFTVTHNICNKITCTIKLANLEPESSGAYCCEISGDAPDFKIVSKIANMTIAALPLYDPDINGIAQNYIFGDFVSANCTSDKSSPPANLTWYINDDEATADILLPQYQRRIEDGNFILEYSTLEIRFTIDELFYGKAKQLDLKCVATIPKFPSLTRYRSYRIYVSLPDDLTNQKLVKNTGTSSLHINIKFSILLTFIVFNLMTCSICMLIGGIYDIGYNVFGFIVSN